VGKLLGDKDGKPLGVIGTNDGNEVGFDEFTAGKEISSTPRL